MIRLENIVKIYNKGKRNEFTALHGITLNINKGQISAITGTSGAGKSTLLHIIALFDRPDEGKYFVDDKSIFEMTDGEQAAIRNSDIGIIMQDYALIEDYTVIENIMLPLDIDKEIKRSTREKKELAHDSMKKLGIEDLAYNRCNQLSGGQKQRVAIARAIINKPKIIVADEPTGALDSENTKHILDIFDVLRNEGNTIIIATHDEDITNIADVHFVMSDGRLLLERV